jgi:very-short-patch-repair endonuclease
VEEPLPGAPWAAARDKLALARSMRKRPTPSERRLWEGLRERRLGFRFRRQHVIGGYIVDFYCPDALLAIEVDGGIHEARATYDRARDAALAALGIAVLRFDVGHVNHDLATVLRRIADFCTRRAPLPPPRGKGPGDGGSTGQQPSREPTKPA